MSNAIIDQELRECLQPAAEIWARLRAYPAEPVMRAPAVYFLGARDGISYVGISTNAAYRIDQHWRAGRKQFDRSYAMAVPNDRLELVEGFYILLFEPYYNRRTVTAHLRAETLVRAARDGGLWGPHG